MKLIMAVVDDNDSIRVVEELTKKNIGVTRLASTGGFLRRGNTTLLIGLEEDKLKEVLDLLEKICKPRKHVVTIFPGVPGETFAPYPVEVTVGGAIVFVLNVERFEKI
ncbi:cyclic-di-AMP receptor [Thermovenabulum sp.]|uniref:cyclic-di-AMP receptor n=1 Tax=Thermovenabulum sp. TaxID=3100335 RepID=UPI003C79E111